MSETKSSVIRVIPEIKGTFPLDENVARELPAGSKVLEAVSYGTSAWTRTAKVSVELPDGTQKEYFLKCATEGGELMMEGEFNSMSAIYSVLPSFVPRPIAWGKFQKSPPETFFFLCDFLEMDRELPDPADFCARLAELHRSSSSPNGQFGFHVKTCHGKIVQHNDWDDNWSSYFTKLLENFYQVELSILEERGVSRWPEHEQAFKQMCEHAIPQILGPLQENGRTLKPCLVHGDLWEENTSTNLATGESIVFDASAMYAHNEYELGTWRPEHYRFGRPYFRQYLRNIPPSEPVDQWDDRIRLYSIKFNIAVVIGWAGSQGIREQVFEDMCFLNTKYPPRNA